MYILNWRSIFIILNPQIGGVRKFTASTEQIEFSLKLLKTNRLRRNMCKEKLNTCWFSTVFITRLAFLRTLWWLPARGNTYNNAYNQSCFCALARLELLWCMTGAIYSLYSTTLRLRDSRAATHFVVLFFITGCPIHPIHQSRHLARKLSSRKKIDFSSPPFFYFKTTTHHQCVF